ncbi:hypothetical protein DCD74_08540 [Lysobacter oculi]|uniref:DUF4214 domain-containing protein n=1 Tax=Solilutibacter oculi TaxID=2698682 RepID=A0A344J6S1_9GAMM|nr:hypothetical protein [Lysobacter oculi]AXA84731.1 hypothetical protein DCD74_08540 [Lysobacter oculi]
MLDSSGTTGIESVEEVMRRVLAEARRLRLSMGLPMEPEAATASLRTQRELIERGVYHVADFMHFHDLPFVVNGYRALLRRQPSETELAMHLAALREGSATRIELLASLRFSVEGMAKGVPVKKLRQAWEISRIKRIPFVGPVFAWIHGFLRLGRLERELEFMGAAHAMDLVEMEARLARTSVVATGTMADLAQASASTEELQRRMETMQERLMELESGRIRGVEALSSGR